MRHMIFLGKNLDCVQFTIVSASSVSMFFYIHRHSPTRGGPMVNNPPKRLLELALKLLVQKV